MRGAQFEIAFILGAPRSGTTLLRTILNSHPGIIGLPETPWLLGSYGPRASLRELVTYLCKYPHGIVHNVRESKEQHVFDAAEAFIRTLIAPLAEKKHAEYVVFKTPDDVLYLDELVQLFPKSKFIHIRRDGRDVVLSTLDRFPKLYAFGENNPRNAIDRWIWYEQKIQTLIDLQSVQIHSVQYEDMVTDPFVEMEKICNFLGATFYPEMLHYGEHEHDLPLGEVGSRDVAARRSIDSSSVRKWASSPISDQCKLVFNEYSQQLGALGYEPFTFEVNRTTAAAIRMREGLKNICIDNTLYGTLAKLYKKTKNIQVSSWYVGGDSK